MFPGVKSHLITTKESFVKRYTVISDIYSPTDSVSKYIKQTLIELQKEIEKPTIRVKRFQRYS